MVVTDYLNMTPSWLGCGIKLTELVKRDEKKNCINFKKCITTVPLKVVYRQELIVLDNREVVKITSNRLLLAFKPKSKMHK